MIKKILKRIVCTILLMIILIAGFNGYHIFSDGYDLYIEKITNKPIDIAIKEIEQKDNYVELKDISSVFKKTLVQTEDQEFYEHSGIDVSSIIRAAIENIKKRKLVEGGSTISQQLSKNMYFSFEKTFKRKVAEYFVTKDIEQEYSKDKILELYCNIVYFGNNQYGIEDAANYYYSVSSKELSKDQSKALVKTLKSPNRLNPKAVKQE